MSHSWDDYRSRGRTFTLEVREEATARVIDAQVRAFERAIKAYARSVGAERHGIPTDDVFLDALTKRVDGWGTLRIWAWLTVHGRAFDLNRERLWPWQLRRAMRGGMPPSLVPTPRTGGTQTFVTEGYYFVPGGWLTDDPEATAIEDLKDKPAREGGQAA